MTDMQAAVSVAQLDKLDDFIARRNANFKRLLKGLKPLEEFLLLPKATKGSEPSWFGFPITVKVDAPFSRFDLVQHIESQSTEEKIDIYHRLGNIKMAVKEVRKALTNENFKVEEEMKRHYAH